MKQYDHVT